VSTGAWLGRIEETSKAYRVAAALCLVAAIAFLDFRTGWEVSFAIFYLLPIALVAWTIGAWTGAAFSALSAAGWFIADVTSGSSYSHSAIPYWNALVRLGFFLLASFGLANLKEALTHARTDVLTGLANRRAFLEILDAEIARAHRYGLPITVAYLDVDGFKEVNDRFGHARGDDVLRAVAGTLGSALRTSDTAARFGGDEFAVVLPQAGEAAARRALEKLHDVLIERVGRVAPAVGFSIGAITCPPSSACPAAVDLLQKADQMMYAAKRDGSHAIRLVEITDLASIVENG
jgi:diguanylate cyclase (GGDEF)-like protein